MINPEKCQRCDVCQIQANCDGPNVLIRESNTDMPWVDFYKCRGCMKCKNYCPNGAVEGLAQPCNMAGKMSW